ncbi:BamA/TamA family outer membrane protein [Prevotella copri]|uniref:BamA/TamA family outer membrane protein n=4 Tax=root TaxID=1 RepID=A0A6A7VZA3_9BACT|nr:BamA/TamA family outer membrane protein [Segatella copri]MQN05476.1 BamA/TamA family outer membrane protein [Segatella copri]MQN10648.1 BamA/TamA family outer membrane protein [Segatella copri]MQO61776.1 BamA/TamA family outer membrane protein [Segatella copri]MQO64475.1 BamA/TamA family outer membrane protein [Segatella copri]
MKHILTILIMMLALGSYASELSVTDSISSAEKVDTMALRAGKSWVNRILDYFNDSNKNKKHKRFDFSVIGGPHYASDTKFGLGLVAAGLYRTDPNDSILPPSNVSLYGDVSSVGFYMLGVRGNHIAPKGRYRIDYHLYFYSFPADFWGIGYEMGDNDANKSDMKRWQAQAEVSFLFRVADNFYIGPMASYDYVIGKHIERPELLQGMDQHTWNVGAGVSLVYDNRDNLTNPHRGIYLNINQMFRPRFMGNDYAFSTTAFRFDAYQRLGKGTVLAEDIRANLNFGNPSWGMMAELGGTHSMRGYYEGRYRDKHSLEATVELRQHVWKRNGIVVWVGAGTIFPKFSALRSKQILPNAGVGYRWEFKKNVNVRLDYGFGKSGQSGFLFNINEAF